MINKYKFNGFNFLMYSLDEIPDLGDQIELLEENVNLELNKEDQLLEIVNFLDFILANTGKKRVRDKILAEEGISSFYDLQCAYNLLRNRALNKSVRIRKFVEEKYSEIINLIWEPLSEKTEEDEEFINDSDIVC